jgi:DNA polymerase III gamma/tau subunit
VHALAAALSSGDSGAALAAIRAASGQGVDMNLYLSMVLDYARAILLARHAPELRKELAEEAGEDQWKDIESIASARDSKVTHHALLAVLVAASRVRYSPVPSLPLELAVFELADPQPRS